MDTKQNTEPASRQSRKTPVVSITPDPEIDKLARKAKIFTSKTKTFIYEECVRLSLQDKTADEIRQFFKEGAKR